MTAEEQGGMGIIKFLHRWMDGGPIRRSRRLLNQGDEECEWYGMEGVEDRASTINSNTNPLHSFPKEQPMRRGEEDKLDTIGR